LSEAGSDDDTQINKTVSNSPDIKGIEMTKEKKKKKAAAGQK
jgi:hypothetical protein